MSGYELKQVKVRLCLSEAEPLYSTERITTPEDAVRVMAKAMSELDREYCCVVNLDGALRPINFNIVSIGDINQSQVPVQNVFKSAIIQNSASLMLLHNHPSGVLNASGADLEVTRRVVEAGKLLNIPVIDHVIVAGGTAESYSMRENMPELFSVKEETQYGKKESIKGRIAQMQRIMRENEGNKEPDQRKRPAQAL